MKEQQYQVYELHSFLNSALNGFEWAVSGFGRFAPWERALQYEFIKRLRWAPQPVWRL
jgi:hypothetical protein